MKGGDGDDDDHDSDAAAAGDDIGDDLLPDFTPPLRIHATKKLGANERLTGSHSQLQGLPSREVLQQHLQRRKSDPNNLSVQRSGSESPQSRGSRGRHHKSNTFDGGSSISSLEDAGIDIDILTDKMGVLELDLKTQQDISHSLNRSLSNLPAVTERMCDETLEDVHAFSDVKREPTGGTLSRGGSITTGGEVSSNVLEPLSEIDEDFDEDDDDDDGGDQKIKITNMAEILEVADEDEIGEATGTAGATVPST